MNRPKAAKTSEPIQTQAALTIHRYIGIDGLPVRPPTAKTTTTDARPRTIAVSILITMYATGESGVSRSWRLQPAARSIETIAPPLVVARTAPYSAMLIMMNADTLPWLPGPADWLA